MTIYQNGGNWVNGCSYVVIPDGNSDFIWRDGEEFAKYLFSLTEEEFIDKLIEETNRGYFSQIRAEKTMSAYIKRTLNAYEGGENFD